MRKFLLIALFFMIFIPKVYADEDILKNARSGILIDNATGEVLYEKNSNERVSIASLTKMMAQIIILENIESGHIKWNDIVVASSNASGMGGTQIWLSVGEKMSVEDLFKGVSIASANDATVALAEHIAGTEENFVKLMNDKKDALGLRNTNFVNCTGLDEDGHYSSAYDLSIIARELLKHNDILKYSSIYEDYIRVDTPNKYWLVNTNKLIRFYDGADGLKTGFTDAAHYTIAATAKRNDLRLIAIVLGEDDSKVRNNETMDLLNYGFDNYKIDLLKKKGEVVDYLNVEMANKENVPIVLEDNLAVLNKKTEQSIKYDYEIIIDDVSLPITKGDKVGVINLKSNNAIIKTMNLVIDENIKKIGFISYLIKNLFNIF